MRVVSLRVQIPLQRIPGTEMVSDKSALPKYLNPFQGSIVVDMTMVHADADSQPPCTNDAGHVVQG